MPATLIDTGPLVAYLYPRDTYHNWAVEQFLTLDLPFTTCEPVITEVCFLLARNRLSPTHALEAVKRGIIKIDFRLAEEAGAVQALMERYGNVPMSLADACLVQLAEMTGLPICTLDSDFTIYRPRGRGALTLISPMGGYGFHEAEGQGDAR
jgi:uncharacterized protein